MGYLSAPQNQFQPGMGNPSFGAFGKPQQPAQPQAGGIRRPTGRVPAGGGGSGNAPPGGGVPWGIGHGSSPQASTTDLWAGLPAIAAPGGGGGRGGPTHTGAPKQEIVPGWLKKLRRDASGAFAGGNKNKYGGPDIPGQRDMPEFTAWEGEEWTPQQITQQGATDIEAVMAANSALMQERLGGEMGEAARKFGNLGMMQSAGGLGSGYLGTLGESERGVRRDLGEIEARYGFEAAQAAAQIQHQQEQNAADRAARAWEASQGREHSAWGREQDFNWDKYAAGTDADRWAYDKGVQKDVLGRQAESDNIALMMSLYG